MSNLFALLFVASLIALAVSLIKPSWLRLPSRKMAGTVFGIAFVVTLAGYSITAPPKAPAPVQVAAQASAAAATTTPVSAPAPTASKQVAATDSCTPAVLISFPKVTTADVTVYQEGRDALGTMQYQDVYAGLDALNNPSSAASKFSAWHRTFLSKQSSLIDLTVNAYKTASDCYYNSNLPEPDAIANWRDDMGNVLSDVGRWGLEAASWQIQDKVTTAQLNQDEAAIASDLATVQQDLAALKK